MMLCRVGEHLFWLGRYMERAIAASRLIDVTCQIELDSGRLADEEELWASLIEPMRGEEELVPEQLSSDDTREVRRYRSLDISNSGSVLSRVRHAREAAREVRSSISSEMWEQVNDLYLALLDPHRIAQVDETPAAFCKLVQSGAQLFQGLCDATLNHDETWAFLELGQHLERADAVARALLLQTHLLLPNTPAARDTEVMHWLTILRSCGSAEAYAHYYSLRVDPVRVVEFLLFNPRFPQSLRYNVAAALERLRDLGGSGEIDRPTPAHQGLVMLRALLDVGTVDVVLEGGLRPFLVDVLSRLATVAERVTHDLFRAEPQAGRVVSLARAAMVLAAQQ